MKFSVAPESTRASASALFAIECMKNRTVIDFRVDIYTSSLSLCLISADLIRRIENPLWLPFLEPVSFYLRLTLHQVRIVVELLDLLRVVQGLPQKRHQGNLHS